MAKAVRSAEPVRSRPKLDHRGAVEAAGCECCPEREAEDDPRQTGGRIRCVDASDDPEVGPTGPRALDVDGDVLCPQPGSDPTGNLPAVRSIEIERSHVRAAVGSKEVATDRPPVPECRKDHVCGEGLSDRDVVRASPPDIGIGATGKYLDVPADLTRIGVNDEIHHRWTPGSGSIEATGLGPSPLVDPLFESPAGDPDGFADVNGREAAVSGHLIRQ